MSDRPRLKSRGSKRKTDQSWSRALFDAQNDIDRRREQLIAEIEGKLQQRVTQTPLFSIRWSLE
jgi:hypothetical protein